MPPSLPQQTTDTAAPHNLSSIQQLKFGLFLGFFTFLLHSPIFLTLSPRLCAQII